VLIDYLADHRGGNLCFFMDCEIVGRNIKAEFAYWHPKQRGLIGLINQQGDRVVIEVPEFVWDLDHEEFLYKAEYPITEYKNVSQDQD
jgi:hypothetical protein